MNAARGTTPTFILTLESVDLTQAENVYVTIRYHTSYPKAAELTKTGEELTVTAEETDGVITSSISLYLTQEETLAFNSTIRIQVNWTYSDGQRGSTEIKDYKFSEQLLNRVVE